MGAAEQQASLFGDATPRPGNRQTRATKGGAPYGSSLESGENPGYAHPLAARMRPRTLDEIVGQNHLLAPGRALRLSIERDTPPSMVLWGPPGSGKTTLASVIAQTTRAHFVALSAVTAGVADLRRV